MKLGDLSMLCFAFSSLMWVWKIFTSLQVLGGKINLGSASSFWTMQSVVEKEHSSKNVKTFFLNNKNILLKLLYIFL